MTDITYFDLDTIVPDQVVVKLRGVEYPLAPVTVEDFVSNTKMLQAIETEANDIDKTLGHTMDLLARAFPTMGADIISSMTMVQMNKLVQIAHGLNGQKEAETSAAATATENPPTAG